MPPVDYSDSFWSSVRNYNGDIDKLTDRVTQFIEWKEHGKEPYVAFAKDKSSATNDRGEAFRPYKDNNYRHCNCGFFQNGDPLIVYRLLMDDSIMLVCVTHHDAMFNPAKREAFVREHEDQFPR